MTRRHPPRLAVALLERFVSDSTPLAGDLIEEFENRQSRTWFWWQVLAAIWIAWFQRHEEICPLHLADVEPIESLERARMRSLRFKPVNLTASPIHGIGGLGLVCLALLVTKVTPTVWWMFLGSVLAGVALGLAMIAIDEHRESHAAPATKLLT
jgi:hypothetical protein